MSYIKIVGFKTFPEMKEYENTAEGRKCVYNDLNELTGHDLLAMNCSEWCSIAQIGEKYVDDKFVVEIC